MEILVSAGLFGFPGEVVGGGEMRCGRGLGHGGARGDGRVTDYGRGVQRLSMLRSARTSGQEDILYRRWSETKW